MELLHNWDKPQTPQDLQTTQKFYDIHEYTEEQIRDELYYFVKYLVNERRRELLHHDPQRDRVIAETAKALKTADHFGLMMMGDKGNGKTTLAYAVRALMLQHADNIRRPRDFYHMTSVELCQLCIDDPEEFQTRINGDGLIIDDIGVDHKFIKRYGTTFQPVMDAILNRYNHMLFTIVTTNLSPSQIEEHYDGRIRDRLREMCAVIRFEGMPSYRK